MRVQKRDRFTFTLELSQMSHFNIGNINMNINIYIYIYAVCPSVLSCPSHRHGRSRLSVRPSSPSSSRRRPYSLSVLSCTVVAVVVLYPAARWLSVISSSFSVRPSSARLFSGRPPRRSQ